MKNNVLTLLESNKNTVFEALSIEIIKVDGEETILGLSIDDRHRQHLGLVHGGIYALLEESAASIAAGCSLTKSEQSVVALEINANHIRATKKGTLRAFAKALHRGSKTMVYEVRVQDDLEKLVSIARCTLMIVAQEPH